MTTDIHNQAVAHLLRSDGQEDLCFALWFPSKGRDRSTALVNRLLLPRPGEREVHGNAAFRPSYFLRALAEARRENAGLAFLHSHPTAGWQGMSADDFHAEDSHAGPTYGGTFKPLVGMTIGSDGAWSARLWQHRGRNEYERSWCESVRVVGDRLSITYHPSLKPPNPIGRPLSRTVSAWGDEVQSKIGRLRIGVVGTGSVGAIVAECLARIGVPEIRLLDFDFVEAANLDRLLHATQLDAWLHRPKVDVLSAALYRSSTNPSFRAEALCGSIAEVSCYRAALDCDVLFCCVDRPWPRHILNLVAFAHLIPVIDGGIRANALPQDAGLRNATWKAHTATPLRACLECLDQYRSEMVSLERDGYLDDPRYIEGLGSEFELLRNENVFPFSLGVASLELLQFVALIAVRSRLSDQGAQTYHFPLSTLDTEHPTCQEACIFPSYTARGDIHGITVTGSHPVAQRKVKASRQGFRGVINSMLRMAHL